MEKGIALAGNICVDILKKIDNYPNPSSLTTIREITHCLGGAVCNCSIALSKIDKNISLKAIGIIGNDTLGDFVINSLNQYKNIDLSKIYRLGTTTFTDVMADDSNKTRTFFIYRGASSLFSEEHIDINNLDVDLLHIAYILLLDKLDSYDEEYGTNMAKVLFKAKMKGIKTSIDIVSEESDRYPKIVPHSLKYTDYCIINELEASKTVGIPLRDNLGDLILNNIKPVLKKLQDFGVNEWIIIHSPEASFGLDKHGNYYICPSLILPDGWIKVLLVQVMHLLQEYCIQFIKDLQ